jgi:hypothetical protein
MNLIEKIPELGVDVARLRLREVLFEPVDCCSVKGGRRFKAEVSWLTCVTLAEKPPDRGGDAGDWPSFEIPFLTVGGGSVERRAGVNTEGSWLPCAPLHVFICDYRINP